MQVKSFMFDMIRSELEDAVGVENVSTSEVDRASYTVDYFWLSRMWQDRGAEGPKPDIIVRPGSSEEVSKVLKIANYYKIPVHTWGSYTGISAGHTTAHFTRATLEGVAFSLRHCMGVLKELGVEMTRVRVIGGGAKGLLWRQIVSDVLGISLEKVKVDDSSFGTAMLAAVGIGWFDSFAQAAEACVQIDSVTTPIPENQAIYDRLFQDYKAIANILQPIYGKR